jgi:uncharacterized protein (DUF58 family)
MKGEVVAHLAALLSFSASRNNDPVGLIMFSDQIEHFVPPKKGRGHIFRILRDLYYFKPKSRGTNIRVALEYAQCVLRKRSTVFVFSDFVDQNYDSVLRRFGKKHEVVAVVIEDQSENKIPDIGIVDLEDAETGEVVTVDTSSPLFQREYQAQWSQVRSQRDDVLKKAQVAKVEVFANQDIVDPLIKFFKTRNKH